MAKLERIDQKVLYGILFGGWNLFSRLPFFIHYLISDVMFLLVYYVVRYRRNVVRKNLKNSFPEKSRQELRAIERKFYLHFCDIMVESVKYFSVSPTSIKRHLQFKGLDLIERSCRNGKSCAVYLGHYGNWEWVSSLQLWLNPAIGKCVQLYHPLENPVFDKLIGYSRERLGSTNIPMEQSLRHIVKYRKEGIPLVIGFIADQVPLPWNIHYWSNFLNQDTPFFTGSERLARQLDMDVYYMEIQRVSRGHYIAEFHLMTENAKACEEFALTEMYSRSLEKNIQQNPPYWLWSHNRWKRSRADWMQYKKEEQERKARG